MMRLESVLKTEVNSAMLTFENHSNDNSFFESKGWKLERQLEKRKYEAIGLCKNVPFKCACHMPEEYWFILLRQYYTFDETNEIIKSILE